MNDNTYHKTAIRFILLFGMVSLFADVTYEGARSITGPFLETLGASAAIVGFVVGFGELVGYGLRLVTGWLADRTRRYWLFIVFGYGINLLAVPLLAFAGSWEIAAVLMITERFGKGIRTPARDAILSQATAVTGHGKGFGLHEMLDQIGAVVGPVIISVIFFRGGNYSLGFAVLFFPAILSLTMLGVTRRIYTEPHQFKQNRGTAQAVDDFRSFVFYLAGIAFIALGFADYPLIAYHFKDTNLLPDQWIPLAYALAMGMDAAAGLGLGLLFDRWKRGILVAGVIMTATFAPLVFLGSRTIAFVGVIIWGIGMGFIESVLRASVATLVASDRRGRGYGLFNGIFGFAWFAGSAAAGYLYEINIGMMVAFLVVAELLALPFLWRAFTNRK